ncbi:MAG: hypothetical protein ICV73_14505 [Acetobacteraceae bacterium]|nr:hypothetical protein [Acetobacteraceae bacterium]
MHAAAMRRWRADIRKHARDATEAEIDEMLAEGSERLKLDLYNIAAADEGVMPMAAVIDHSDEVLREGEERLARLLPKARELACGAALGGLPQNLRDALIRNNAGLADVQHVLVYEAPKGQPAGFHGDVDFGRTLPPIGGAIGTKVASPEKSPEGAERFALTVLIKIASLDAARRDPYHPLAPRTQDRVHELVMFTDYDDRMLIDFPASGDPDYDLYRIGQPARLVERGDYLEMTEKVFSAPGDPEGAKIGLAFVRHCRDNAQWFGQLQEAARRRRLWEKLEPAQMRDHALAADEPPAAPEAVAGAAELMVPEMLDSLRAEFRAEQPGIGDKELDAAIRGMLTTLRGHKPAMAFFLRNMRGNFPTLPHGVDTGEFSTQMLDAALRQLDGTTR